MLIDDEAREIAIRNKLVEAQRSLYEATQIFNYMLERQGNDDLQPITYRELNVVEGADNRPTIVEEEVCFD